jgi:mono/diheme cytochrome c family protein
MVVGLLVVLAAVHSNFLMRGSSVWCKMVSQGEIMFRTTLVCFLIVFGCKKKEERGFSIVQYDSGDTEADADTDADADADADGGEFGQVHTAALAGCSGCHNDSTPAADLSLSADQAYDSLMAGPGLVVPGDPESSYLVQKMRGDEGITGDPMPPTAGATAEQISTIESWIADGANP